VLFVVSLSLESRLFVRPIAERLVLGGAASAKGVVAVRNRLILSIQLDPTTNVKRSILRNEDLCLRKEFILKFVIQLIHQ
jgi:hypothetical protein